MNVSRHLHALDDSDSGDNRARGPYSNRFKLDAVARVVAGQPVAQVARELSVARNTLKSWLKTRPDGPRDAASVDSGLIEAAASGSRRAVLVALRTEVAARIANGVTAQQLPATARLLDEIMKEVDAIDAHDDMEANMPVDDEKLDPADL